MRPCAKRTRGGQRKRLGHKTPDPILCMEVPFHYRNKAIATFAPGPKGKPVCGIYESHTHRVVPVRDCLLQDSRINDSRL